MKNKYDLVTKLAILKKRGIDFISVDSNIDREKRLSSINNIIAKIVSNPDLLEKLESIDDEFWDEVVKTGILIYEEMAKTPNGEAEYLLSKRQSCYREKFETIDGETIELDNGEKIPALVYQIKKG